MDMRRIGVIGASGRGNIADYAHIPDEGFTLVAGADLYPEGRERFLKRQEKLHNTPHVYSDYREMIEKEHLDGVIITTPDFLHEEHAVFALEHGFPVYLE